MAVATQTKKATAGKKKNGLQIKESVQSMMDNLWKDLGERMEVVGSSAKTHSAGVAVSLIKLQKSAFDNALKVVAKVQKQAEKLMKNYVEEAGWMPPEGKDIVKEWNRTLNEARGDFQKTVDKSYDLLQSFFERVKKDQAAGKSAAKGNGGAAKTVATKKPVGKKKPAVKRAATMAAADKSSASM